MEGGCEDLSGNANTRGEVVWGGRWEESARWKVEIDGGR